MNSSAMMFQLFRILSVVTILRLGHGQICDVTSEMIHVGENGLLYDVNFTPKFNGKQLVFCKPDHFYNADTKTCENCTNQLTNCLWHALESCYCESCNFTIDINATKETLKTNETTVTVNGSTSNNTESQPDSEKNRNNNTTISNSTQAPSSFSENTTSNMDNNNKTLDKNDTEPIVPNNADVNSTLNTDENDNSTTNYLTTILPIVGVALLFGLAAVNCIRKKPADKEADKTANDSDLATTTSSLIVSTVVNKSIGNSSPKDPVQKSILE